MTHSQETRGYRVDVLGVEFPEVAVVVDEDCALERFFCEGVITYIIVGEIIEDFEGEEVAGCGDVGVPGENGAVDYLHVVRVASRRGRFHELGGLQRGESGGYFNDFEFRPGVHVGFEIADEV